MLRALTLFRVCLVIAIVSFGLGVHYAHRIFAEPIEMQPSRFDRIEERLHWPASLLATAILPREYTTIICEGAPPANIGWVTGSTLVAASTLFWTSLAAGVFILLRRATHQRI
jgi:hypothetical protein